MFSFLWNLGSFIIALGILVAVHEWGHYYVARLCGVHVKRFSIGFGKALWKKHAASGTEYVVAAIPLGGYVRMLDTRVDEVSDAMQHQAFDNKPVLQRMAIIAAGPGINFVFAAVALYIMYLIGVQSIKPVIGDVKPQSLAAQAQLQSGEEIVAINGNRVYDWESVNLELVSSIGNQSLSLQTDGANYTINLAQWNFDPERESSLNSIGIEPFRPKAYTRISVVADDSPAKKVGLRVDDVLIALNDDKLARWQDWVVALAEKPGATVTIQIERQGQLENVIATLGSVEGQDGQRGYLGVVPVVDPWPQEMIFVHEYGVFGAVSQALQRTWRLMTLSVEMIGKLITGDVSVKNLSGPISIAQGAGASAGYGLVYFLSFLALISVNLGIINLLPLPMLDGGHLMYFIIEWIRGKPVSEEIQEIGFRIGGVLLFALMGIALFNDIARLS